MSQTSISEKQWHEIDPRSFEPASPRERRDQPASTDESDAVKAMYDLARSKALAAFDTAAAELDFAFGEYQRRCRDTEQSYRTSLRSLGKAEAEASRADDLARARFAFNADLITIATTHDRTYGPKSGP